MLCINSGTMCINCSIIYFIFIDDASTLLVVRVAKSELPASWAGSGVDWNVSLLHLSSTASATDDGACKCPSRRRCHSFRPHGLLTPAAQ